MLIKLSSYYSSSTELFVNVELPIIVGTTKVVIPVTRVLLPKLIAAVDVYNELVTRVATVLVAGMITELVDIKGVNWANVALSMPMYAVLPYQPVKATMPLFGTVIPQTSPTFCRSTPN